MGPVWRSLSRRKKQGPIHKALSAVLVLRPGLVPPAGNQDLKSTAGLEAGEGLPAQELAAPRWVFSTPLFTRHQSARARREAFEPYPGVARDGPLVAIPPRAPAADAAFDKSAARLYRKSGERLEREHWRTLGSWMRNRRASGSMSGLPEWWRSKIGKRSAEPGPGSALRVLPTTSSCRACQAWQTQTVRDCAPALQLRRSGRAAETEWSARQ